MRSPIKAQCVDWGWSGRWDAFGISFRWRPLSFLIFPLRPSKRLEKKKSEAFREAIRTARLVKQYQAEGRDLRELPAPKAAFFT